MSAPDPYDLGARAVAATIASFGALVQACRYVELGEADA